MNYSMIQPYIHKVLPAMGSWWAGKGRLAQVGYIGAGAYLGALGVGRALRAVRRPGNPPPGRYTDVYAPGLVNHQRRIGHWRMGASRSQDHLRQMYGGGV